jgi:hypothetical protein
MSPAISQAGRIAELNDRLRARVGIPAFQGLEAAQLGTVVMTQGVMALEPEQMIEVWAKVRGFDAFTGDNDPYGERDFGAIDIAGVQRIFWKIDYYADANMNAGSDDPADPAKSFRVLTIMLAEEY